MDIKERFYANLDLIREDYDLTAKKKAKAAEGAAKGLDQLNKSMLRPFPDFVKDAKGFRKDAKRLKKKAVTGMDEETEQMDEVADGKLFRKSAKMIKTSNLDRNRNRNKDNRSTPDLSSKIKKNLKTSNLDRNRNRNKDNRQD